MFDKDGLWLARAAAYNKKNRFIPYWCEEQKQLACHFSRNEDLGKEYKKLLFLQYHAFLQQTDISNKDYYRYQYIYHQYQYLIRSDNNLKNVFRQLRRETGYKENKQIKAILTCLNAF